MSDLLRMTGLYSGMDTESIVTQLVSAKKKQVTNLKGEQTKLEWKQNVWQDMNKKIYSLYSSTLSNLRLTSSYKKKSTTCSDTTKATVVASASAVNGTQTLKVNKLAKSGYLTGAELKPKKVTEKDKDGVEITKEVDWAVTDKFSEMNSELVGKKITISTGTGEDEKIKEIEITDEMTISDFTSALREVGVNASFDTENQRFFISSKGTGLKNEFTLTSDTLVSGDSTLSALGLDATDGSDCTKIAAQDAEIVLNEATFRSDSNTFSINGLTINAVGETKEEISIVTSTDYEGIYDTIKDFISEYNEIINEIYQKYNADSARDYDMLTDEEKESMTDEQIENWEDKIKSALLRKDSTLSSIMNAMNTAMTSGYYTNHLSEEQKKNMTQQEIDKWYEQNGNRKYLFDFGIEKLSYFDAEEDERYAFHIDGDPDDEKTSTEIDKLKTAIAKDPEGTAEFFASLCKNMYEALHTKMQMTDYSSIYKVYEDKRLQKEYDDYTKKIKEAEEKLSDYEDKWFEKFSAMEVALSKLQSNQNAVSSMLGM